ncbi:MAG: septum formation initiator family protein [SAR324 cluster bacterium]|nr:septum formation initiator family protein [SAR324 cluster bacterium]
MLLAVGGVFLTAMILMTLLGEQGLIAYLRMQREAEHLRTEVRELQARQRELTWQVRALREEPGYVELLARQKLGLAKPGETIIQLPPANEERP